MRIHLNFNREYFEQKMLSKNCRWMMKIGLIWVFIISIICFTRIDALFLDVPPKRTQYANAAVFDTNFYWIHGRRGRTLFGLCIEGKDGNEYYLHYDAIVGDVEELRNRINWSES